VSSAKCLAFDHSALIERAAEITRNEVERLDLPRGFLPAEFTLGELQVICEQLLGRRLDMSSFRRRLADLGLAEPIEGATRGASQPTSAGLQSAARRIATKVSKEFALAMSTLADQTSLLGPNLA
jgi:hypothetical protein